MKKLTIFGGSGMTGQCVVEEALRRGLSIRVLLRDPNKLPTELRDKVDVITGDVLNEDHVNTALTGADGVVVTLGTRNVLSPTHDLSNGLKNITSAMKKQDIKKISVCLSAFLFYPEDKVPSHFIPLTDDHRRMYNILQECELDYVAVFPPHIADQPKGEFLVKHDEIPGSRVVSKRDLASFLIDSLSQPEHYSKRVGISSK